MQDLVAAAPEPLRACAHTPDSAPPSRAFRCPHRSLGRTGFYRICSSGNRLAPKNAHSGVHRALVTTTALSCVGEEEKKSCSQGSSEMEIMRSRRSRSFLDTTPPLGRAGIPGAGVVPGRQRGSGCGGSAAPRGRRAGGDATFSLFVLSWNKQNR